MEAPPLSETEPISMRPRAAAGSRTLHSSEHGGNDRSTPGREPAITAFNRAELTAILDMYGRKVAAGEWRDYALDMGRDKAVFSIFRRTSEVPLYRVEKTPRLARKQGMYAVVAAGGMILKRGQDLMRVLQVLDKTLRVVG
jgi:hypothetical protein